MDWRNTLLAPIGVLIDNSMVASAGRTTQRYLHKVNAASRSADLDQALGPLLDSIDHVDQIFANFATIGSSGKSFWNRNNFAKYVEARLPGIQTMNACVLVLWRISLSSAFYPFSPPIAAHIKVSSSGESEIDLQAYKRAFALLIMRGFELFGAKQDGRPLSRKPKIETSYINKVPRLTRIIFRCLNSPLPEPAHPSLRLCRSSSSCKMSNIPSLSRRPSRMIHTHMGHL